MSNHNDVKIYFLVILEDDTIDDYYRQCASNLELECNLDNAVDDESIRNIVLNEMLAAAFHHLAASAYIEELKLEHEDLYRFR